MARMRPLAERFWEKVRKGAPDECWEWAGATNAKSYGRIGLGTRQDGPEYSHRVAYLLAYGVRPGEMQVCHRCDSPKCCNPAHLFLGTWEDNMADMHAKGRASGNPNIGGEQNPKAKLTAAQVLDIRARAARREPHKKIARRYGVSACTVGEIHRRDRWGHLC